MDRMAIHEELKLTRQALDKQLILEKKQLIINKLSHLLNPEDYSEWLNQEIPLYVAPIHKYYKGRLVHLPIEDYEEIYIDENFYNDDTKSEVIKHQLTHELFHSLSQLEKNNSRGKGFGHYWSYKNGMFRGVDEAVTQMFTDNVESFELNEFQDKNHYFIKNIMRILKVIIGEDKLLMQYLSYNNSFEDIFNEISNNQFDEFVYNINQVYKLSCENRDLDTLKDLKQNLILFIRNLIEQEKTKNSELESLLEKEFENNDFLSNVIYYKEKENTKIKNLTIYKKIVELRNSIFGKQTNSSNEQIKNQDITQISNDLTSGRKR